MNIQSSNVNTIYLYKKISNGNKWCITIIKSGLIYNETSNEYNIKIYDRLEKFLNNEEGYTNECRFIFLVEDKDLEIEMNKISKYKKKLNIKENLNF